MTNQVKTEIGKKLEAKRKEMKLTKNAMIYKSGLSSMQIKSVERNEANYTFETLLIYANALGFEIIIKGKEL